MECSNAFGQKRRIICAKCSGKSRYFGEMPVFGNFGGTAESNPSSNKVWMEGFLMHRKAEAATVPFTRNGQQPGSVL